MNREFWLGAALLLAILLLGGALSLLPRHSAQQVEQALKETRVSGHIPKPMAARAAAEALLAEFQSKRPEFSNVKLHFFEYPPTSPYSMLQQSAEFDARGLSFGEAMRKLAKQSGTRFIEKPDAVYFYEPWHCGVQHVPALTEREKFLADLELRVRGWAHWFGNP